MKVNKNRKFDNQTTMVYNTTNRKNYTIEGVKEEIYKVQSILKNNGFEVGEVIGVHFNKRMTATCGRCVKTDGKYHIEFGTFYLSNASDEAIRNTIAHEVVHTVKGCFNHGNNFKYTAYRLSFFGYKITTINKDAQYKEARRESISQKPYWMVKCPKCGYKYRFRKKSRTIEAIADIRCNKEISCPTCGDNHLAVYHVENGLENKYVKVII